MPYEHDPLSERVIGCAFTVANTLGHGFLEKVYENALAIELRSDGMKVEQQRPMQVMYRDAVVGEYQTDLLVEDQVLVELKACRAIDDACMAQCLNYLKATALKTCLLLNFGSPRLGIKRISL